MDAFVCKTLLDEFLECKEITNDVVVAVSYMVRNKEDTTKGIWSWDKYKNIAEQMKTFDYIDDWGNVLIEL